MSTSRDGMLRAPTPIRSRTPVPVAAAAVLVVLAVMTGLLQQWLAQGTLLPHHVPPSALPASGAALRIAKRTLPSRTVAGRHVLAGSPTTR